jgi:hypothetical protein
VYARNDVWRNKVWMDPADYVLWNKVGR